MTNPCYSCEWDKIQQEYWTFFTWWLWLDVINIILVALFISMLNKQYNRIILYPFLLKEDNKTIAIVTDFQLIQNVERGCLSDDKLRAFLFIKYKMNDLNKKEWDIQNRIHWFYDNDLKIDEEIDINYHPKYKGICAIADTAKLQMESDKCSCLHIMFHILMFSLAFYGFILNFWVGIVGILGAFIPYVIYTYCKVVKLKIWGLPFGITTPYQGSATLSSESTVLS